MRLASLDLGSNTFLMLVCDQKENGELEVVSHHSTLVRLFQGLTKSKKLHAEALIRVEECFKKYKKIIDESNVDKVVAVATSAARDAENADEFFSLGNQYGIPISIISGEDEAQLSFLGATYELGEEAARDCFVVDVGGGSTEIILKEGNRVCGKSLNIGSVRLFELFDGREVWTQEALSKLDSVIADRVSEVLSSDFVAGKSQMLCVAGTPIHLSAIDQGISYDEDKIYGYKLSLERLEYWRSHLSVLPVAERVRQTGLEKGRADVIICGMSVLMGVMKYFKKSSFAVSTGGVRYGLALETFQK